MAAGATMTTTLQLPHDLFGPGELAAEAACAFTLPDPGSEDARSRLIPAVAFAIALLRAQQEETAVAILLREPAGDLCLQLETNAETTAAELLAVAS